MKRVLFVMALGLSLPCYADKYDPAEEADRLREEAYSFNSEYRRKIEIEDRRRREEWDRRDQIDALEEIARAQKEIAEQMKEENKRRRYHEFD